MSRGMQQSGHLQQLSDGIAFRRVEALEIQLQMKLCVQERSCMRQKDNPFRLCANLFRQVDVWMTTKKAAMLFSAFAKLSVTVCTV